jgi:hypothetical protein
VIGDRERRTLDDIAVIWFGHGVELAERVKAFADDIEPLDMTPAQIAEQLREVLTTDLNPLQHEQPPPLGDPPPGRAPQVALQPMVLPDIRPSSPWRTPDPGE